MKQVYIAQPDAGVLGDIEGVFRTIDSTQDKYKRIVNPFGNDGLKTATLSEILGLTESGSLDLMVLPLHLTEESRRAAKDRYDRDCAIKFDGVLLGLRYKEEGYSNPVLLATDDDFSGTQAISVEEAGGFDPESGENYLLRCEFLNLYSTQFPEESKIQILRHLLEVGVPKRDALVLDMDLPSKPMFIIKG